ncbi:hypothetical protein [Nitratifractor sp.]
MSFPKSLIGSICFVSVLFAGSVPTLTAQEQHLSRQLYRAYIQNGNVDPLYRQMRQIYRKLQTDTRHNPNRNLVDFIGLCLNELSPLLHASRSVHNQELVRDLLSSIEEGSRFLSEGNSLAAK